MQNAISLLYTGILVLDYCSNVTSLFTPHGNCILSPYLTTTNKECRVDSYLCTSSFQIGCVTVPCFALAKYPKAAPHYATEPSALRLSLWARIRARGGSRVMLLATFFLAKQAVLAKETADGGCNPKMRPHCLAEAFQCASRPFTAYDFYCLLVCRV